METAVKQICPWAEKFLIMFPSTARTYVKAWPLSAYDLRWTREEAYWHMSLSEWEIYVWVLVEWWHFLPKIPGLLRAHHWIA